MGLVLESEVRQRLQRDGNPDSAELVQDSTEEDKTSDGEILRHGHYDEPRSASESTPTFPDVQEAGL